MPVLLTLLVIRLPSLRQNCIANAKYSTNEPAPDAASALLDGVLEKHVFTRVLAAIAYSTEKLKAGTGNVFVSKIIGIT